MTDHEIKANDRGVSVSVRLNPPLRITERFGSRAEVELTSVGTSFSKIPPEGSTKLGVMTSGSGLGVNQSGKVGNRRRSNVSVHDDQLPEELRAAMVQAVRDTFLARSEA